MFWLLIVSGLALMVYVGRLAWKDWRDVRRRR